MAKVWQNTKNAFKKAFHAIGDFCHRIKEKVAHHKLFVLVMMQLKDKWNISWKTNKKAALFKLVGYLIIFAVMIFIVNLVMNKSATTLGIFATRRIPLNAMLPILLVVTVFEAISILFGMTKALYFSKDNVVLITYPVKSNYLFMSKLIVYYIDALKKSCMLLLPIFISFGMIYSYRVSFYLFVVVLDLIYVAFLVLLCGILSIPTYYITRFLNKYRVIKIVFSLAILGLLIYGSILLIGVIPSNINLIRQYEEFSMGLNKFLYWFRSNFFITSCLGQMFFGIESGLSMIPFSNYSWIVSLCLLGLIALLVVVNALLSKPFYDKMIATSNRSSTHRSKEKRNRRYPKWLSSLHYEFVRNFRDERLIIATLICVITMPLIALVTTRFYGSFNTRPMGDTLIYLFNFIFIMVVVSSHNVSSSYIYSKDGPSWTINKTMPIDPKVSLSLRLVYNFVASLLIIIPSSIIFFGSEHAQGRSCVVFILTIIVLATFHSVLSASYDFSHSKNKDKADIGSEIVNGHTMVSLGFGFLITIGMGLFIMITALTGSTSRELRLLVLACVLCAFELFYFFRKIHLTYQEN